MFNLTSKLRLTPFFRPGPVPFLYSHSSLSFSQFFRDMDKKSILQMHNNLSVNKQYKRIMDEWQKPLERKMIRR